MKVEFTEWNSNLFIALLAEFVGTALLMSLGCLGYVSTTGFEKSHIDVSMSFGLILMISIHVCAPLSGGHINPWVSTAACILGHIKWDKWLMYFLVQILGGLVGYSILYLMIPERYFDQDEGLCISRPKEELQDWQEMSSEFLATSVYIFVWAGSLDKRAVSFNEAFAIRIGFVKLGLTVCLGYFSGTGMNLAHTLPPAIYHGGWEDIWQATTGQVVATILISVLWRFVFANPFKKDLVDDETNSI